MKAKIGIINVSDRASQGVYEDIPGKEAAKLLSNYLVSDWEKVYAVVPDEADQISAKLKEMSDHDGWRSGV